jgi:hypothetical protein
VIKAVVRIALICLFSCGTSIYTYAATITLFDDSLGTLPGDQPYLFYAPAGVGTQTLVPAGVQLSTSTVEQAGYSNFLQSPPALDRSTGFNLDFELQILSETHTNPNRAGFSIILLSSDLLGIEIAFWDNEIWAQAAPPDPIFTHAEGVIFDTASGETAYSLQILNSGYSLVANSNLILSGSLRDYSSGPFVYSIPDYLFIGDNTTSAAADIALGTVQLHTLTGVPIPAAAPMFIAALLGVGCFMRRRCDL